MTQAVIASLSSVTVRAKYRGLIDAQGVRSGLQDDQHGFGLRPIVHMALRRRDRMMQ